MDIDELIAGARAGVPSAGPLLVSVLGPQVAAYARRISPDLSDTDRDLVAELAIEKAVRRVSDFDASKASFPTWLRGFVRHGVQDWRRSNQRLESLSPDQAEVEPTPHGGAVEDARLETAHRLAALVPRLKDTDQAIIQLRTIEGLSYEDIARLLDVNEAACRQRHRRALGRLRELARTESIELKRDVGEPHGK